MKILVNAGHSVKVDSGAVGSKLKEAEVALNVAKLVVQEFKSSGFYAECFQQTKTASKGGLKEITTYANKKDFDWFISIHCNASSNKSANGTETLIYAKTCNCDKIAKYITDEICKTLGTRNRGVKVRPDVYVLKYTKMPALLVELAFISNPKDEQLLATKQAEFAKCIVKGFNKYAK